jgi:hypothetical protein
MVVPRAADADRETRAVQINRHVGTKVMSKDQNASFGSCRSEARGWTPYDFWRRTHAIHHATSGNLDRRGTGDIDTLTVHEYLALSPWRPSIFVHRSTSAASRAHACWLATLAQRDGNQRRHRSSHRHHDMASRRRSLRARASTDHTARGFDRSLAVLCPAPIRGYRLGSLLVGTARAQRCGLLSILFDPRFRQLELLRDVGIYFIRKNLNGFGEPRHMPRLRDLPSSHPSSQEASSRLPLCHKRSGAPSRR